MPSIPAALRRAVLDRANGRCEYCLIHNADSYIPHEVDHIVAEKHGGLTQEDNLCLSCFACNRHKGSDLTSIDSLTESVTLLYHPRRDRWDEHFRLNGAEILALTGKGRVTIQLLKINDPDRLQRRDALTQLGRYP